VPDYSDPTPAYIQIADDLRGQIAAGMHAPGDRLPSNKALTDRYKVADGTVRQALERLRAEGIIATQSTRGTFVVGKPAPEAPTDLKAVGDQLADLKQKVEEYDDLRARVGRLEAILIDLYAKQGYGNPFGGTHDTTERPAARRRAGRR
jgi:DNA-binding GntR family transcriptional regulator